MTRKYNLKLESKAQLTNGNNCSLWNWRNSRPNYLQLRWWWPFFGNYD